MQKKAFYTTFLILFFLFSPNCFADKIKISVGKIEYRAKDSSENKAYSAFGKGVREDTRGFIDMLNTALVKTRKFEVIERDRMAEIIKEQGMSMEGVVNGGYEGDGFNLQGVDFIVTGSITEYGQSAKAMSVGGFSSTSVVATMAVDIKILNVQDGTIEIAETVKAQKKGGNKVSVDGFASGKNSSSGELLGQVMRETSTNVANLIVSTIFPVKVVAITKGGSEVMLNYGNGFLKKGHILEIFSQGEVFIDPDTGDELGCEEELIGKIQVYNTQAKFSKAKVMSGKGNISKGMICRLTEESKETKKAAPKKKKLW